MTLSGLDSSPLLLHANITYVVCGGSVKGKTVTNKIYVPYVPFSGIWACADMTHNIEHYSISPSNPISALGNHSIISDSLLQTLADDCSSCPLWAAASRRPVARISQMVCPSILHVLSLSAHHHVGKWTPHIICKCLSFLGLPGTAHAFAVALYVPASEAACPADCTKRVQTSRPASEDVQGRKMLCCCGGIQGW